MTSMIDVLVVMTVFLLITVEASPHCDAAKRQLPTADNVEDVMDAPLVDVSAAGTFLDGIEATSNEELVTRLKARRDTWRELHPGKETPRNVLLAIDPEVASGTVKAGVEAAADGGYPSIDFMANRG